MGEVCQCGRHNTYKDVHSTACYRNHTEPQYTSLHEQGRVTRSKLLHQDNVKCSTEAAGTHHSPPEGVRIAAELGTTIISKVIFLSEVDKI